MKYKLFILIVVIMTRCTTGYTQVVTPGSELQELVKISDVYRSIPNLSFYMYYTYADSLTWTEFVDSMLIDCQVSYGKTFLSNEDMEILQGSEYIVYVDKLDSFIIANPVQDYKNVLQMPLLDSVFREANVTGMNAFDLGPSWRVLNVFFKPESNYLTYKIEYDPNTGLIYTVNFHARNENGAYGLPTDHIVCATVNMGKYSEDPINPTVFNENRYFYKLNGTLYLQQAWQQFHFQN